MAFPHEVCNICYEKYGRLRPDAEKLVRSKCLGRPVHKSVVVRVRVVDGILEAQIRPLPKVHFIGYFVDCDPDRCRREKCTFPHCSEERRAWNAQKFGLNIGSLPAIADVLDTTPRPQPAQSTSAVNELLSTSCMIKSGSNACIV